MKSDASRKSDDRDSAEAAPANSPVKSGKVINSLVKSDASSKSDASRKSNTSSKADAGRKSDTRSKSDARSGDTRSARKKKDRYAPVPDVFEELNRNLRRYYIPGALLCIDEQLVPFRGRCGFIQYMPKKPEKYGLKNT